MDEATWLASTDPSVMLEFLKGKASDRKLRLFACSCCRRAWEMLTKECYRSGVEIAEAYADGLASKAELRAAMDGVWTARYSPPTDFMTLLSQNESAVQFGRNHFASATYAALATTWDRSAGNAWQAAGHASRYAAFAVTGERVGVVTMESQ